MQPGVGQQTQKPGTVLLGKSNRFIIGTTIPKVCVDHRSASYCVPGWRFGVARGITPVGEDFQSKAPARMEPDELLTRSNAAFISVLVRGMPLNFRRTHFPQ